MLFPPQFCLLVLHGQCLFPLSDFFVALASEQSLRNDSCVICHLFHWRSVFILFLFIPLNTALTSSVKLWGRNCIWRALELARKRLLCRSGPAGREKASPLLFSPSTTSFCPGSLPTRSCVHPPYSPNYPTNSRCQTFWYIPPFPSSPGLLPSSCIYPCISVSLKVWLPLSCTEIFSVKKCKLKGGCCTQHLLVTGPLTGCSFHTDFCM